MNKEVAKILLKIKAVKIQPNDPFIYTSGLISPIYIDNRFVISFVKERKIILDYMVELIGKNNLEFDIIAGVATAGIHWAAWLAAYFKKPMIYIRGKKKGHGRQNQIEGYLEKGKKVLVIEDHISTGGSSIAAIQAVRENGGIVDDCIAISTYEFIKAQEDFNDIDCNIFTLTNFTTLINTAVDINYINSIDREKVLDWNKDAPNWAKKYGIYK
jgi:orotate phosphoribosyltransferase